MASLQCKVCFEEYSEINGHIPRMLSCGHTICEKCAEQLLDDHFIRCPLDREITCVSSGDVKDLCKNYTVLEVLQERSSSCTERFVTVSNEEEEKEEEKNDDDEYLKAPCNENEHHVSDYFCDQCKVFLCESCFNLIHAPKVLSGHTKTAISEMPIRASACAKHAFNAVDFICEDPDCEEEELEICHVCYMGKESTENYKLIKSVMPSYRKGLIKAIKHSEKNSILCQNYIARLETIIKQFDETSPEYQNFVQKITDEIYAKETETLQTLEDLADRLARENSEEFAKLLGRFGAGLTFQKMIEHVLEANVYCSNTEHLEETVREYEGYVAEIENKNLRPLDEMRLQLTPQMNLVVGEEENE